MQSYLRELSFRSKILMILLLMTLLLSSIAVILTRGIDQINDQGQQIIQEDLPALEWLYQLDMELSVKTHMMEQGARTGYCCSFTERYQEAVEQASEERESITGHKPVMIDRLERELDYLDFLVTNHIDGLLRFSGLEAVESYRNKEWQEAHLAVSTTLEDAKYAIRDQANNAVSRFDALVIRSALLALVLTTVAIVFAFISSYRLSNQLTKPLVKLESELENIALGSYGKQLTPPYQKELANLTVSVNRMSSELKKSFETIIADKRYRDQVLNALPLGIITYHESLDECHLNQAARSFTGMKRSDILELFETSSEEQAEDAFTKHLLKKDVFSNERITYIRHGAELELIVSKNPLKTKWGDTYGYVFQFMDITEVSRLEEQVKQAEKLAVVGELAAGAAHEIRNPLTVIDGFLSLMDQTLPEKDKERFQLPLLKKEAKRIDQIIEDMLLMSKPGDPILEEASVNELMEEMVPLVEALPNYKDICFSIKTTDEPVLMDKEQMKQVVHNLFRNAVDAMDGSGEIRVTSAVEEGMVKVQIGDSGPGIPEPLQAKLFDPFRTSKKGGTGLGLTIAQRILQNHGGTIRLLPHKGTGACFELSWPTDKILPDDAK
ncbi:sensor histidine kinase [Salisediminibacterium selenitireducens]|uniref:histidine kinase n=1 Tax=Bacillus selenitireducens (strain ATCC 700615 / DSM 15326 / MLS10) TaxID=439292 RepID=D6Y0D7_BACIE|nr:ATP-binding protein [Salisediminibacterium selenitireducens]ADH98528.1 multi-sensor signal transduction histidine kinase [[Bacillus] selenitireducens MLS10]